MSEKLTMLGYEYRITRFQKGKETPYYRIEYVYKTRKKYFIFGREIKKWRRPWEIISQWGDSCKSTPRLYSIPESVEFLEHHLQILIQHNQPLIKSELSPEEIKIENIH